ncbi:MAG TPA: dihydrofolate reductase family protein [Mariprofundaceae bacterium]|nr:dihydrofolate reductase family protein [Mariprofundaceae bacterium]
MTVLSIYPSLHHPEELPLAGFYLSLNLHRQGDLLIYANFIASLDGRIAVRNSATGEQEVPAAIANPRDWRLYQELAAQSDIMLTSARYFRQLAKGRAQDLLPVGGETAYADLRDWRKTEGLREQPDVAVLSRSLDIPLEALEKIRDRKVYVFTDERADDRKVQLLQQHGMTVVVAGAKAVDGGELKRHISARGYRSAYMIAGPGVFRTLIQAGIMNRLFLTTRHTLLGGHDFQTLLDGELPQAERLHLMSLALDLDQSGGQSFAQYAWPES